MKKPLTDQQTEFLVAYRTEGRVKPAAARAGCSRELHYNALRTSETYRKAFEMVQRDFVDELEEEMRQRAIYGVKIPKFYRGELIGYEIRYSDTLLMALLEANNPEKFGGIREELREQDGDAGFCVRWDREEVGRPTLPRMTGPMPPAPPRPPRPPVPSIAECGEPVTYAEWAAARGIAGAAAYGPVDQEKIERWGASENLGSVEWVPEEAAMDLVSDDADADLWQEAVARIDAPENDDSDVDFCVRWGAAEPDGLDDGSALQASEEMEAGMTRPDGPGWGTGWPFRPEERRDCGRRRESVPQRSEGPDREEHRSTMGRISVRKRRWRGGASHGDRLPRHGWWWAQPTYWRRPVETGPYDAVQTRQAERRPIIPLAGRTTRPLPLPNTHHWRGSVLRATHRSTPPRSSGTLVGTAHPTPTVV